MSITITGASDDLIEIEGDVSEEFSFYDGGAGYLAVSDGTIMSIRYDNDGIWRIQPVRYGVSRWRKTDGVVADDTNDVVTIDDDVKWVLFGKDMALASGKP